MFKERDILSLGSSDARRARGLPRPLFIGSMIIALLGVAGTAFFYQKYTALHNSPSLIAQREEAKTISSVSQLMELPSNEMPSIATITDKEKLSQQSFFQAVENGDMLLAYVTSKKAILYRPSTNKIINVASLALPPSPVAVDPPVNASSTEALRISGQ